jgi:RNA polymerase sigma-70 factor (ECF subfamily)
MDIAAQRRDAPAVLGRIETLFHENLDAVFNVGYRVLWNRSDAEDVVQRTFLKAITRLDQLREPARARPWLLQIAYREAIGVLRSRREVPTDPADIPEVEMVKACPAEAAVASDIARILDEAFTRMDPDERLAVVLRDVEQLAMREVADVLEIGLSAAKMRVHRGRASLRQLVATAGVR